ncbi:MAG TPA: hypothetical protein VN724_13515 [Pyrinomonadaceae bacterium]|nr:hypothetical protein [Pyrinomonadaceae bacterium]
MNQLKKPIRNQESIRNLELVMLRAFVVFDIAQKLVLLAVVELQDAGKKTGWW